MNISELVDENYVVYTAVGEDGGFYMKLFCVNPAGNLQKCLDKGISTVFFFCDFTAAQILQQDVEHKERKFWDVCGISV